MTDADNNDWIPAAYEPGLVSIIIPTYNREALLKESLDSLLAQDYRPVEIVVVDDGSTDGTLKMLEALDTSEGVELRAIAGEHEGAAAARNRGARHCRGEFVMFHDSDDIMQEGALAALVEGIGEHDLAFGKWRDWYPEADPPRFGRTYDRTPGGDLVLDLLRNEWLLPSAVLHKRQSLRRVDGWDAAFATEDDFEFMMRFALAGAKGTRVPKLVTNYRRHEGGQLSASSAEEKSLAVHAVLKRCERALENGGASLERREALAARYWWEARMAWLKLPDHGRFHELIAEARRIVPEYEPPKWWYRVIGKLAGYANAERVAGIGRKVFR